ncbi:hypothetical protein B0H63DRAFT_522939 [Podospora didyma]|uniref:lytic cellulose monooxygenase (C4-dehydrogenating) n=1 Tax=Podospora didyma TaxID=330526 RepID=A0AAE0U018_9PEZI|nr:hypothetical protein B0H63DRAFT_522939 [Podospora didyma]
MRLEHVFDFSVKTKTGRLLSQAHYRWSKLLVNNHLTNDFEYIRENSNGIMPTKQFLKPSDDFAPRPTKPARANTVGFQLWYYATMQHPGPLTIHMSKVPSGVGDIHNYRGDGEWFKLPRDTPPGQYPVRVEHIAIYGAQSGDTEFYFECA